jgi:hypothetical protein
VAASAPNELFLVVPLLLGFGLQLLFTVGLWIWGRRVAAKHGGGRAWRWVARMPFAALATGFLGAAVTVAALTRELSAVANAPAAQKANLLSEGIARAMLATAVAAPVSLLLYLASVVVFAVGSTRSPRWPVHPADK